MNETDIESELIKNMSDLIEIVNNLENRIERLEKAQIRNDKT